MIMKEKDKRVELRLPAKEKEQLEQLAKKCGLSISEYLRKRGLGYEPGPLLDERFYAVYSKLCEISNLPLQPETEAVLITILSDLQQNLFLPRKQSKSEIVEEVRLSLPQDFGP
jgi:hypothetical protein